MPGDSFRPRRQDPPRCTEVTTLDSAARPPVSRGPGRRASAALGHGPAEPALLVAETRIRQRPAGSHLPDHTVLSRVMHDSRPPVDVRHRTRFGTLGRGLQSGNVGLDTIARHRQSGAFPSKSTSSRRSGRNCLVRSTDGSMAADRIQDDGCKEGSRRAPSPRNWCQDRANRSRR